MRQTVAVSLPSELTERLDAVAAEEGTSRSEIVRDALRRYLALRQFQRVRESVVPFAEAAGLLTDDDVLGS
jgi:metal-responsive CopG/Arc/MetJ family transcriptional regulator